MSKNVMELQVWILVLNMAFKDNTLEFFGNKILDTSLIEIEVMMDWIY